MPGKIVVTSTGKNGRTKNTDKPMNGKVIVYLDDGPKILCRPENLKVIGFWD